MNGIIIYPAGKSDALQFACQHLEATGFQVVHTPGPDVTHLVLPVPSFEADGSIRGGGILEHILADLPEDITVIGGNLCHPGLSGYKTMDLLQDPYYVAKNAAITAHCAVHLAASKLPVVLSECRALVLGWGRIGKCLAALLQNMGAHVTVAARKSADRAMLAALGYRAIDTAQLTPELCRCNILFNTVPELLVSQEHSELCSHECLKIDLASRLGIAGKGVIWARGLPGKDAPESSGRLIAETIAKKMIRKEFQT